MSKPPIYWLSHVPSVDDFGHPITTTFIDGKTRPTGHWAMMSPESWTIFGVEKFGLGIAQKFERQDNGTWLCVEGGDE